MRDSARGGIGDPKALPWSPDSPAYKGFSIASDAWLDA